MRFYISFVFSLLIVSIHGESYGQIEKICTNNYNRDACNNIARDQNYTCTEDVISKTDCFLNIDKGLPQFTIVYPEEALLAAPLVSDRVVVIGEVIAENKPYQTAVIVRKPYDGGFEKFKGKRFCHPGNKHDELVTRFVLEEFENKLISLNASYCNTIDNITLAEKRTRALASLLGPSCRPGVWSDDDELDGQLKSKYPGLCELCGPQKCDLTYDMPFENTLKCLIEHEGDVALTTFRDATAFFNDTNNRDRFQYLCQDGSVHDAISSCTWTNQLNRLVIAGKDAPTSGFKAPRVYLEETMRTPWGSESLRSVLNLEKSDNITFIDPVPLKKFVEDRRKIPSLSENTLCNLTVKWCTLNDKEQQKCLWLSQASLNAGLQPTIVCAQSTNNDSISCLSDIASGDADLGFNDVNYGYVAMRKGLTVIAYPDTDVRQLSSIVIVVRNDTTDIKSLRDLKGRSACFPEYGGKEWLAFIDSLKSNKIVENSCDYDKLFSNFVGSSCAPGARTKDYGLGDMADKLCDQCVPESSVLTAKYCNADFQNKYFTSNGALRCLSNGNGDYALVTINDVSSALDTSNFRVISKNGSLSEIAGLKVDEKAPLTIITAGGVVVKNDTAKKTDIVLLLRGIEKEFGESLKKIFQVFESFDGTKDLLFPDSTPGLSFTGSQGVYVENFKTLLENAEKCQKYPKSSASYNNIISSTVLLMLSCFVLRF